MSSSKRLFNGRRKSRRSTRNIKYSNICECPRTAVDANRSLYYYYSWYIVSTNRGIDTISILSRIIIIRVRTTHPRLPLPKSVGLCSFVIRIITVVNQRRWPVTTRSYYETLSQSIPIAVKLTWSSYLIFYSFFPRFSSDSRDTSSGPFNFTFADSCRV